VKGELSVCLELEHYLVNTTLVYSTYSSIDEQLDGTIVVHCPCLRPVVPDSERLFFANVLCSYRCINWIQSCCKWSWLL